MARSGPAYTSCVSTRHRHALTQARRLVVKVGSSSLTTADGELDLDRLHRVVDVLAAQRGTGTQVVLVSSGAIAAGIGPLGLPRRPRDLATQQAAASVGQGALLAAYSKAFGGHGLTVGQILLTADDVTRRSHYANARRTLDRLLDLGVVPVVNENDTVATHEIRVGDNDRLAALVAHLVHADALLLLSDVDALYDGPPARVGTTRIPLVRGPGRPRRRAHRRLRLRVGTGGMATKVEAAGIATAAGITTVLTSTAQFSEVMAGHDVGTVFAPHRLAARLPAALAGARDHPAGPAAARPGCGPRGRRPAQVAAAGRHRRGRGQLRRR